MATCPVCKTEQSRRLNGSCPNCHALIDIYEGRWFQAGPGSPAVRILHHFENLVSSAMRVAFIVPKTNKGKYTRELAAATKLLSICDWDLDLVCEVLTELFTNKRLSWRTRSSLVYLESDFLLGLAFVKSRKEEERARVTAEAATVAKLQMQENLFV